MSANAKGCADCGDIDCDLPAAKEARSVAVKGDGLAAKRETRGRLLRAKMDCERRPRVDWQSECARRDETIAELVESLMIGHEGHGTAETNARAKGDRCAACDAQWAVLAKVRQ